MDMIMGLRNERLGRVLGILGPLFPPDLCSLSQEVFVLTKVKNFNRGKADIGYDPAFTLPLF